MDCFKLDELELPRYSDKYRPSVEAQPTLKRKDLNEAFFPPAIFDMYFNPKKKRKGVHFSLLVLPDLGSLVVLAEPKSTGKKPRMNLDELGGEEEDVCTRELFYSVEKRMLILSIGKIGRRVRPRLSSCRVGL